jgi:hypothetical protein
MKISVEQVKNNLALLPKFVEQEEIRNKILEMGEEVAPNLYQVQCHKGRIQHIRDNIDTIAVENPKCWGCPLAVKKGIKACFNILTSLDTERWYKYNKCPSSLKARSLLLYGIWGDPFEISKRFKRRKKTG